MSAWCSGASVISYLVALLRGDLLCAGEITAIFIGCFFLFGLAAVVLLIVGIVRRLRTTTLDEA